MRNCGVVLAALSVVAVSTGCSGESVKMYETSLVIPTYEVGRPDPNPRFYMGRAYQGAEGRVYPYPMLDQLSDRRINKTYKVLYLENEYLRIGVLPEIGGRVFEAVDKTNGYDFLYRQHVIKPALIGMLGAWISGGIEWNFPHHHRSRAFMPVDYTLEENPDGSKTIWLSEIELRHRMKFTVGITLYPGRSYFEATVRPYNRTPLLNSFLYWANVSVHAKSGEYQVIFPPGTEYATYHGKNQFSRWPVAQESYRGIDYGGLDISWWKNHPSPISFFAWNYEDDFFGGYDHAEDAGVVYVADHRIAPGKKFWEWGPGPQGRLWDEILTDQDGPYVELMAGAYSDNQPDYSWIQPYEAKLIKQYWYPIRQIGRVKNATLDAAVSLEVSEDNVATIGINATAEYENARALLRVGEESVLEEEIDIGPAMPFSREIPLAEGTRESDLRVSLVSSTGDELVAYRPTEKPGAPLPEVVTRPPDPEEIETVEELFLAGLRLEQFHNPALDADSYYEEALRRDPGHSRANVALGIRYLKRGMTGEAVERLRTAVGRTTKDYTSPKHGEAHYYLGLALRHQGDRDAAYDTFYKATWSQAFHSAAYYQLALIDCMEGEFGTALDHLERSIATNAWNANALSLRAAVLRRLGRPEQAQQQALQVLEEDPLNLWARNELHLISGQTGSRREVSQAWEALQDRRIAKFNLREDAKPWHEAAFWLEAQPFLEIAIDYGSAGLWDEAIGVVSILTDSATTGDPNTYPMLYYYLGYFYEGLGDQDEASAQYRRAATMPSEYGFPFRLESIAVLRAASRSNPDDALAHYYLGNLLYDHQPEAAIMEWERARQLNAGPATLYRNLALAYTQVERDLSKAIASMEQAVARDASDPRLFYELDLMYEAGGISAEQRLALLQQNHETIVGHNDAYSREIVLLTQLGRYDEAIAVVDTHHFRRWEGVGNTHTTYVDAHLLRGLEHMKAGRYEASVRDYEAALRYPENLEAAEPYHGGRACQVYYLMGTAYQAAGDAEKAREFYEKAMTAKRSPGRSVLDYYQGMAFRKLGQHTKARELFDGLIAYARQRLASLEAGSSLEFFAKFGTRRSLSEQKADAYYFLGLGYLGSARNEDARRLFARALSSNPNHLWARAQLAQ